MGVGGTLTFTVANGGTGYVQPQINIPQPSYENLEVVGVSRLGIGATTETGKNLLVTVDVGPASTVGIGSTLHEVTSFSIARQGYGFRKGDVFNATVGVGGTLTFTVANGGTGYVQPQINIPQPSYENLEVVGVSRLGIGATTETGKNLLVTVDVGPASTVGIGSTLHEVTSFSIARQGYGFRKGDVFKPVGLDLIVTGKQ